MRRRRRKSRAAGLAIGAAFSAPFLASTGEVTPEPQPQITGPKTAASGTDLGSPSAESAAIPTRSYWRNPGIPAVAGGNRRGPSRRHATRSCWLEFGVGPRMRRRRRACSHASGIPRDLRPGQRAAVLTQSDRLLSFRLALAPDRDIVIARDHTGGFIVEDQDRPTREVPALGNGTIHTSSPPWQTEPACRPASSPR